MILPCVSEEPRCAKQRKLFSRALVPVGTRTSLLSVVSDLILPALERPLLTFSVNVCAYALVKSALFACAPGGSAHVSSLDLCTLAKETDRLRIPLSNILTQAFIVR